MAIEYEDFILTFDSEPGGDLLVRVHSPAGEAEEQIQWRGEQLQHEILEVGSWRQNRLPVRNLALAAPSQPPGLPVEEAGRQLFDFAFQGRIRILFDQSLGLTRALYRGLRIVLRFDVHDAAGQRLADLPWETICRPESGGFFVLDPRTPIVRYLDVPESNLMPPLRDVPRVLIAFSAAADLALLQGGEEAKMLRNALRTSGIEALPPVSASAESLALALKEKRCHAFHYIGHGGFDQATGKGVLFFEQDGEKTSEAVSGERLATMLAGATDLRFVFLNACNTAVVEGGQGTHPFSDVAGALVRRGVPAVLAMQAPIPDAAALELSTVVYDQLAQGASLEEALGRGRIALRESGEPWWSVPVLFTRVGERVLETAPLPVFGLLWTLLGLVTFVFTFNTWSDTQGWRVYLPELRFTEAPAAHTHMIGLFGVIWGAPLLALLLAATRRYSMFRKGWSFAERLPVAFGYSLAHLGSLRRLYQGLFFALFLAFPMAAQIHFFDKMRQGQVTDARGEHQDLKIWTRVPWKELDDDGWHRFRYVENEEKVTFYPFVQPLGMLIGEVVIGAFFLHTLAVLFAGAGGIRRSRNPWSYRRFARKFYPPASEERPG